MDILKQESYNNELVALYRGALNAMWERIKGAALSNSDTSKLSRLQDIYDYYTQEGLPDIYRRADEYFKTHPDNPSNSEPIRQMKEFIDEVTGVDKRDELEEIVSMPHDVGYEIIDFPV